MVVDAGRSGLLLVVLGGCPADDVRRTTCADGDGDGRCDEIDLCVGDDVRGDNDEDGVCDDLDVCPTGRDDDDVDGDGVPAACDDCPGTLEGAAVDAVGCIRGDTGAVDDTGAAADSDADTGQPGDTAAPVDTGPNEPPVADAGDDITGIVAGSTVNLSGSGTDPDDDPLTYAWALAAAPAGSASANLANETFPGATLYVDVAGTYALTLTVSDGRASDRDEMTVTVSGD